MDTAARFLLAKYAPDLTRMEPRNVGVVVWAPSAVAARFLGEQAGNKLRAPRKIVTSENRRAYRQWITYWRILLQRGSIKTNSGAVVHKSSPTFTEVLRSKSKPHFLLVDGGFLMDNLNDVQVSEAADELFESLVEEPVPAHVREHTNRLTDGISQLFQLSGLQERADFRERFPVQCTFGHTIKPLTFDYAVGETDEIPKVVFQKVRLPQEKSVTSAAFKFYKLKNSKNLKPIKRCALVYSEPVATESESSSEANVSVLKPYGHVVDVARPEQAAEFVRHLLAA